MQYLRARYYNPATGTFNRLDPFAGNMQDPQSLHKYLYTHGDPIQGIDPTGETLLGTAMSIGSMALKVINVATLGYLAFRVGYSFGTLGWKSGSGEISTFDEAWDEVKDVAIDLTWEIAITLVLRKVPFGGAWIARKLKLNGLIRQGHLSNINGVIFAEGWIAQKYIQFRNAGASALTIAGRVPDFINSSTIREVKNVAKLGLSGRAGAQLRAFANHAAVNGQRFYIHVRPSTQVAKSVTDHLEAVLGPRGVAWDIIDDIPDWMRAAS